MKCFMLVVILMIGLSLASGAGLSSSGTGMSSGTGNTPWQEGAIEGLKIGFHTGQMYALAQQGQNISGFNSEVDKYNAWVQKNFGDNAKLLMPKTIAPSGAPITSPSYLETFITSPSSSAIYPDLTLVPQRTPFNASSDLGKFGKKQVLGEIMPGLERQAEYMEAVAADQTLRDFLRS
jgi:hypothetical protein